MGEKPAWRPNGSRSNKNVQKFVGVYGTVVVLNESGTLQEKILHKPLDLYILNKEIQSLIFLLFGSY
jgi:hypothetical protein